MSSDSTITALNVSVFKIPCDFPESDGTYSWDYTILILVKVIAGDHYGFGYTYGNPSIADVINHPLKELVIGQDCFQINSMNESMIEKIRNDGSCGIAFMALSAIDTALWDLKARILGMPLCSLLGMVNKQMLVYGSGGFTSYSHTQIKNQFEGWASSGIRHMKIKIGRNPADDINRVKAAKSFLDSESELFVDANGAYDIKQALYFAEAFRESDVKWFEEPVSSDNLNGLSFIRKKVPPGMNITAGEYGYNLPYFSKMVDSVDILQADITRCGGITGFLKAGYLCEAKQIPFSSHCAPTLHLHAALSLKSFYIAEYFHDHVRIENEFFDGVPQPVDGYLLPDMASPGLGIELKTNDIAKYRIK